MAVEWSLKKLPISTDTDFEKILAEFAEREEDGWDLEHIIQADGSIIAFFKRRIE